MNARMFSELRALLEARAWVARQVADATRQSVPLRSLPAGMVAAALVDDATAGRARVAVVDQIPTPPLPDWACATKAKPMPTSPRGITLDHVVFLRPGGEHDASLLLHELVHVIQWRHLGVGRFLAAYGLLLLERGYDDSPLETMAYELQQQFDDGDLRADITPIVQRRTDEAIATLRSGSWSNRVLLGLAALM